MLCCALAACGGAKTDGVARDGAQRRAVAAQAPVVVTSPASLRGRDACRGASPDAIRRRFLAQAKERASSRDRRFLSTMANVARTSATSPRAGAYGAARIYAMSLPKAQRAGAYA